MACSELAAIQNDRFVVPVAKPFLIHFPSSPADSLLQRLYFDFCDRDSALGFAYGLNRFDIGECQASQDPTDFMTRGMNMAYLLYVKMKLPRTIARLCYGDESDEQ